MPRTVAISGRLSDEATMCPPCGMETRRRLDMVVEDGAGVVLQSWSVCTGCQTSLPWGVPHPAVWTEPAENVTAPLEVVPHG